MLPNVKLCICPMEYECKSMMSVILSTVPWPCLYIILTSKVPTLLLIFWTNQFVFQHQWCLVIGQFDQDKSPSFRRIRENKCLVIRTQPNILVSKNLSYTCWWCSLMVELLVALMLSFSATCWQKYPCIRTTLNIHVSVCPLFKVKKLAKYCLRSPS